MSGIKNFKWMLGLSVNENRMQLVVGVDPVRARLHGGAAIGTSGISNLAKTALGRMGAIIPACQKMMEQLKAD